MPLWCYHYNTMVMLSSTLPLTIEKALLCVGSSPCSPPPSPAAPVLSRLLLNGSNFPRAMKSRNRSKYAAAWHSEAASITAPVKRNLASAWRTTEYISAGLIQPDNSPHSPHCSENKLAFDTSALIPHLVTTFVGSGKLLRRTGTKPLRRVCGVRSRSNTGGGPLSSSLPESSHRHSPDLPEAQHPQAPWLRARGKPAAVRPGLV